MNKGDKKMTIWAFNQPSEEYVKFISDSVKAGVSRFGWSWFDGADLNILKNKKWGEMSNDEQNVWSKSGFLLDIAECDWIVHINVPEWGKCTIAKVIKPYYFDKNATDKDFRHCIGVDQASVIEFDRNDPNIHPLVSRKLKLRGRFWRIYCEKEFFQSLENLKNNAIDLGGQGKGTFFLKAELSEPLKQITKLIHKNHDGKNLETFIAAVFREVPYVENVIENGFGWGTDYGADLIIEYRSGLPINGLEKIEKIVVQIKSYEGEHWETHAVDQIEEAINKFEADAGMLITTAEKTMHLQEAMDRLASKIEKPIALLAGEDIARFVLKYYGDELLK
jgi:hypothetical protein